MKITTTLLSLMLSIFGLAQTDSILFLGNSYTYTGDVPGTFKNLAASGGKQVFIDSYTPGGKQLSQHYNDATSLSKINSRKWNFVVLQEQSQMPLVSPSTTVNYAQKLMVEKIKVNNPCTELIMYMTWARQAGNSWLTQINWTHEQMATYYEDFYDDIWQYTTGRTSAVGAAFHKATQQGINVYSSDGSHQNTDGSYLAACVFYATIYKESPVGLSYSTASTTQIRDQLQQIANDIVLNKQYDYNLKKVKFTMSKTSIDQGQTIDLTEKVYMHPFPNSFKWDFEGATQTTSTQENPTGIQYNTVGKFDITLTIEDQCGYKESRTFSDTISVVTPTSTKNSPNSYIVSNNIAVGAPIQLDPMENYTRKDISVFNLLGKRIDYKLTDNQITPKQNTSGYLFVRIKHQTHKVYIK